MSSKTTNHQILRTFLDSLTSLTSLYFTSFTHSLTHFTINFCRVDPYGLPQASTINLLERLHYLYTLPVIAKHAIRKIHISVHRQEGLIFNPVTTHTIPCPSVWDLYLNATKLAKQATKFQNLSPPNCDNAPSDLPSGPTSLILNQSPAPLPSTTPGPLWGLFNIILSLLRFNCSKIWKFCFKC